MQSLVRGIGRYCFRFLLFYWICFAFPFPLDLVGLPFQFVPPQDQPAWMQAAGAKYGEAYTWVYQTENAVCTWVGSKILHVDVIIQPTGSGDTMRAYVGCFCAVVIAAVAALVWTGIALLVGRLRAAGSDRVVVAESESDKLEPFVANRSETTHHSSFDETMDPDAAGADHFEAIRSDWQGDRRLHGVVRVLVRFFLCSMLFGYGFAKVFPLQFSQPSSTRLAQQLGDMSPMGLLWTFMGFSPGYQMFTGAVEVLAGLLLTTRRTTLLGGLTAFAAMTQVFALNMCFDVPVKLYSFNYLLMAFFLIAPDLPRLTNVLVLGRAVPAKGLAPLLGSVALDRIALAFRTLLVLAMMYGHIHQGYERWTNTYGGPPAPIAGRWERVMLTVDGKEPGKDDPLNWSWLDFSNKSMVRLAGPKPPNLVYRITWVSKEKKLTLGKFSAPDWTATFSYNLPEPEKLELEGSMDGKAIAATLRRAPAKQYELINRGFHWISEMPYNR